MSNYTSVTYITKNEDNKEQVEIEYKRTFLQSFFNKPATKQVFISSGKEWLHKESKVRVRLNKEWEILTVICESRITDIDNMLTNIKNKLI